jgi:hypothetical protein
MWANASTVVLDFKGFGLHKIHKMFTVPKFKSSDNRNDFQKVLLQHFPFDSSILSWAGFSLKLLEIAATMPISI